MTDWLHSCLDHPMNISTTLLNDLHYHMLSRSGILIWHIPEYVCVFRKHHPCAQWPHRKEGREGNRVNPWSCPWLGTLVERHLTSVVLDRTDGTLLCTCNSRKRITHMCDFFVDTHYIQSWKVFRESFQTFWIHMGIQYPGTWVVGYRKYTICRLRYRHPTMSTSEVVVYTF